MEPVIAAGAGWLTGLVFSAQRGVVAAIVLSVVAWIVSLLVTAAVVNQSPQPAWVGFASLCFAVAFFFSCRKK